MRLRAGLSYTFPDTRFSGTRRIWTQFWVDRGHGTMTFGSIVSCWYTVVLDSLSTTRYQSTIHHFSTHLVYVPKLPRGRETCPMSGTIESTSNSWLSPIVPFMEECPKSSDGRAPNFQSWISTRPRSSVGFAPGCGSYATVELWWSSPLRNPNRARVRSVTPPDNYRILAKPITIGAPSGP